MSSVVTGMSYDVLIESTTILIVVSTQFSSKLGKLKVASWSKN